MEKLADQPLGILDAAGRPLSRSINGVLQGSALLITIEHPSGEVKTLRLIGPHTVYIGSTPRNKTGRCENEYIEVPNPQGSDPDKYVSGSHGQITFEKDIPDAFFGFGGYEKRRMFYADYSENGTKLIDSNGHPLPPEHIKGAKVEIIDLSWKLLLPDGTIIWFKKEDSPEKVVLNGTAISISNFLDR